MINKISRIAAFVVLLAPLTALSLPIVSTLPQTDTNGTGVGGTNDYAAGFVWNSTDAFAYAELYLGVEGTPAAPLTVSIYDSVGGVPGNLLLDLSGVNPTGEGLYTFTGSQALTMGETYWLVLTTGIYNDFDNEYIWFDGTLGDPNYVDTLFQRPPDGLDWTSSGIVNPAAFAVYAGTVAAPEPGILGLLGIGILCFGLRRRKV